MANQLSKWLILLPACTLLSACLSTSPTQFYVLEPLSEPSSPSTSTEKKHQIGIGPVSIPTLLERKQIVTRLPDNSVKIAEFHQWASPLKDNIAQVLTHNLATLQPDDLIRAYPWSAYGTVDYRIVIDIIRFDTRPEQSVNFEANWSIMNEKNHTLLSNGHTKIEHPLNDSSYPSTVKALNQILSEFSQELSTVLGKLN
ncbi:MAG: PqiC family protein [Methylobacter sp.]|uniref:PqiC family protein n=1 Tax=Candidatus Methylobacter titanis TaxID=3053457 RepID=A0AA43Q485_9GAMM|nr:PqiC family protein [Candidatus Methylobacter titanis]